MLKNKLPKITVVTPVYQGEKYLEKTILSVVDQHYPELEYIIVDGGSTDGTLDIINKYEHRIFRYISEKDNGLYDALNKGFKISTGEIMCWINADDLLHPNCFKQVAEIFTSFPDVEWITGTPTCFDAEGICREVIPQRRWSLYQYLSGDYFTIQQESVFWRRRLFEKAGGQLNEKLKLAGDFDLWMRFFRSRGKLHSVSTFLGGFRRHSTAQLSNAIGNYAEEVKAIYQNLELNEQEKKKLKEIKKLEKLNKLPYIRGKMNISGKLEEAFDFPPEIHYDFNLKKFYLKK